MPNCPFIPAPKSPPKIILQIPPPITVPPRYGGSTGGIHCSGSLPTPCPPSRPRPQQVVQNCHFLLFDSSHGSPVHVCFNKKPKCKPCTAYKSLFIEKYHPQNTMQTNLNRNNTSTAFRQALLPINHPLYYPALLKYSENHKPDLQRANIPQMKPKADRLMQQQSTIEQKVAYLCEKDQVVDILHNYTYTFNSAWAALFTPICEITYPFCAGTGRDGLANFAMEVELGVYNMMVGLHCCVCHSHWMSCQYYPRVIILLSRARLQGSIFGKSHS